LLAVVGSLEVRKNTREPHAESHHRPEPAAGKATPPGTLPQPPTRVPARAGSGGDSPRASVRRLCARTLVIVPLLHGVALAADPQTDAQPQNLGFAANPRAASGFLGSGLLGRELGFSAQSGISIGGILVGSGNWLISGGVKPDSTSGTMALGLHASVDTEKAFGLPGGEFGAQFGAWAGQGDVNGDAGTVQLYNSVAIAPPFDREELLQLWWRQKFLHDKVIFKVGKINASGDFGSVLSPVPVSEPNLRDWTISGLLMVPPAENPTLYGRLPSLPNTAYGAEVTIAPTKQLYISYGIFDGNNARGVQTGLYAGPRVNTYKFNIGEIGYDWRLGSQGKPGLAGIGVWGQTGKLLTPNLTFENGATGFYAFSNQRLWYRHPGKDPSGIIAYAQYGYTNSKSSEVTQYVGFGLTGVGLVPGRPTDSMGVGLAKSRLNSSPLAGAFFSPNVTSASTALRHGELMSQIYYQAVLVQAPWTLVVDTAYSYIPTPGERPNLPAAHALTVQVIALF
jgi:porin